MLFKTKYFLPCAVLLFITSLAAGFLLAGKFMSPPEKKPASVMRSFTGVFNNPTVFSGAVLWEQREYLCGDREKIYEGPVPQQFAGLDRKALLQKFPVQDGWVVDFNDAKLLQITRRLKEICPVHNEYRHLGVYRDMVAVYQGPLGYDEKLLRVEENMSLDSLSPELKIKLQQAMDFNTLAEPAKEKLRKELEFSGEEALNAVLENLDENI